MHLPADVLISVRLSDLISVCLSELISDLRSCHLHKDDKDQDDTLDRVVDQGVHLQSHYDLIDDSVRHGAEQDAQHLAASGIDLTYSSD